MLPALPTGVAEHTADAVPDVPRLPNARPTEECATVALPQEVLVAVNQLLAGDTTRFARDEQGVPAICDASGRPIGEWRELIKRSDEVLDTFRNLSLDAQRQLDARLEHTLPGGSRENCYALERTMREQNRDPAAAPGVACDVVHPQFTLLDDRFNGRRIGGFGDWQVITARGEDPLFRRETVTTFNGTFGAMRFGSDEGYERGAHQFLVSPELDLAAVAATAQTAQIMEGLRDRARMGLWSLCNEFSPSGSGPAFFGGTCGEDAGTLISSRLGRVESPGPLVVAAYARAIDDALDKLPAMQTAAWIEFNYRINMAEGLDGVRVWLYSAETPPTRVDLFGEKLDEDAVTTRCVAAPASGGTGLADSMTRALFSCEAENSIECGVGATCYDSVRGGVVQAIPGHTKPTRAFQNDGVADRIRESDALTGDAASFRTVRINLTDHVPARTWLIFEVITEPDAKGQAYFSDPGLFPRQEGFGIEIADVYAVAEGWHRNVRVKDIAGDLGRMLEHNPYNDDTNVRVAMPPGNEPIVVRIHNAGQYRENGTLTVMLENSTTSLSAPEQQGWRTIGSYAMPIINFTSSEVREIEVPLSAFKAIGGGGPALPNGVSTDSLYRVTARLDVDKGDVPGANFPGLQLNSSYLADPNNTAIRTVNVAEVDATQDDGSSAASVGNDDWKLEVNPNNANVADALLRVYVKHGIRAVSSDGGHPLQVCSEYDAADGCVPEFAAKRGEPRTLALTVENHGSTVENARAVLRVERDDVEANSIITTDPVLVLEDFQPGERRVLTWTLLPTEPGIYLARVFLSLDDVPLAQADIVEVSRRVYVQRTTGTICFDDLEDSRLCAPSFATLRPEILGGQTVSAMTIASDDSVYIATAITETTGALYHRSADGSWRELADLSNATLVKAFGKTPGFARGFGEIRDIEVGPDGTVYLVGVNATILERTPAGELKWHPAPDARLHPLQIRMPGRVFVDDPLNTTIWGYAGEPVPLATGATGGREPYAFNWKVPENAPFTIDARTEPRTYFHAAEPGTYVVTLNVTDADGRTTERNLTIEMWTRPACTPVGGVLAVDAAGDGGPGASDLRCLRASHNTSHFRLLLDLPALPLADQPLTYRFRFTGNEVGAEVGGGNRTTDYVASVWWNGERFTSFARKVGSNGEIASMIALDGTTLILSIAREPAPHGVVGDLSGFGAYVCPMDPCVEFLDNIPDEGNSSVIWRFASDDGIAPTRVSEVLAERFTRGGTGYRLWWPPATDDVGVTHYAVRRAIAPEGPFVRVANVSSPAFTENDLAPGKSYYYTVTAVDARGNEGPASPVKRVDAPLPLRVLHAAEWHDGTLWTVGTEGDVFFLNGTRFTRANLTYGTGDKVQVLNETLRDILVVGNRAWIAGDRGFVFNATSTAWTDANHTDANLSAAWRIGKWPEMGGARGIRDVHAHGGAIWAIGDDGLMLRAADGWNFTHVQTPELMTTRTYARLFTTHLGDMYLIDANGTFATCGACRSVTEKSWIYPRVPVPTVVSGDEVRASLITASGTGRALTLLAGEAGLVFDFDDRSGYDNTLDWETTPRLVATRGVFQTTTADGSESGFRGNLTQPINLQEADRFGVTVRHHIQRASEEKPVFIRLLATSYPHGTPSTMVPHSCPMDEKAVSPQRKACETLIIHEEKFTQPLNTSGWTTTTFEVPSFDGNVGATGVPLFEGIEFYKAMEARWAVDYVSVRARINGEWKEVLRFEDGIRPQSPENIGNWAPHSFGTPNSYWEFAPQPHGLEIDSAWHITHALTDRPVWVANDEVWANASGGGSPRLRDNWNTRLLSPILDLGNAYDPVIGFRHAYAFRIYVPDIKDDVAKTTYNYGETGVVEVQYKMTEEECRREGQAYPCWSQFYRVKPEGGYPTPRDMFGDAAEQLKPAPALSSQDVVMVGPPEDPDTPSPGFWGRSVRPNAEGVIEGVRYVDSENYDDVRIRLGDNVCAETVNLSQCRATCEDGSVSYGCLPINVSGREIRVAFHLIGIGDGSDTAASRYNHTSRTFYPGSSYPGEGWYVTDLKVLGASKLGIDLRTSDLSFRVGYAAERIGVGPGTTVPVNVTVTNGGVFDVLGYTGELEIRRIVDPVTKRSVVVERIPLAQQPLLEPGASQNHTFQWNVPAEPAEIIVGRAENRNGAATGSPARFTVTELTPALSLHLEANGTGRITARVVDEAGNAVAHREILNPDRVHDVTQLALKPGNYTLHVDLAGFTGQAIVGVRAAADYMLTFTATPIGIDADEDVSDNRALLGTFTEPVRARTTRAFNVEFLVTPPDATSDITRYVPIFLNNTGNVALDGFLVKRTVFLMRGDTLIPHGTSLWNTTQPVPPGTLVPLVSVSEEIDVARDLLWRPPADANFLFRVGAEAGPLASSEQKRVTAFATFLFDDVDTGLRGAALRGTWEFEPGWSVSSPGFLTEDAYAFGDQSLGRYPADANASALLPIVDISSASSAKLAFYHRYKFEERFDGGIVEASADGGRTWQQLTPLPDPLNQLPHGYDRTLPMSPASALHPTGDPDDRSYAFTGDTCALPSTIECWIVTEFDLTQFDAVREDAVIYQIHGDAALGRLGKHSLPEQSLDALGRPVAVGSTDVWAASTWTLGPEPFQYWSVENITQSEIRSPVGDDTIWWSGSFLASDDGKRPNRSQMLIIPVDLTHISPEDSRVVTIDWWEWVDRYRMTPYVIPTGEGTQIAKSDLMGGFAWLDLAAPSQAWRFNITTPVVLDRDGQWFHMQSDVSAWKGTKFDVAFVYAPLRVNTSDFAWRDDPTGADYGWVVDKNYPERHFGPDQPKLNHTSPAYRTDRGFAVDAFRVATYNIVNGVPTNERLVLGEDDAWAKAKVEACNIFQATYTVGNPPCFIQRNGRTVPYNDDRGRTHRPALEKGDIFGNDEERARVGLNWSRTTAVPALNTTWHVVNVTDEKKQKISITGEDVLAWYSGDVVCTDMLTERNEYGDKNNAWFQAQLNARKGDCLRPGSESRLITPAFDLARVAGANAELTFTHRFAFPLVKQADWDHYLASGGTVEIQTYDEQTKTWSEWKQLFRGNMSAGDLNVGQYPPGFDVRGGYNAYTVNATTQNSGHTRRIDSPFEPVWNESEEMDLQYLFSGRSTNNTSRGKESICGESNGWCGASFDLTPYMGKTVRIGFHVHMAGIPYDTVTQRWDTFPPDHPDSFPPYLIHNPDGLEEGNWIRRGGWWLRDIAIVGDVLKGAPVQLRLRTASDGNVQDGYWVVDDVGVYGSRYSNNLGIFVDQTPGVFGALPGETVAVPIELRNLGDSVRRNLAIEIIQATGATTVNVSGVAPGGLDYYEKNSGKDAVLFKGYTLAAGQSTTVNVLLTSPDTDARENVSFVVRLREYNPSSRAYEAITSNEIQGFLNRTIQFNLVPRGELLVEALRATPAEAVVGAAVDLSFTLRNSQYGTVDADLSCTARSIVDWERKDHGKPPLKETPVVAAEYPCELVQGMDALRHGEAATIRYRVVPTTAGYLEFHVTGKVLDNITNNVSIEEIRFHVPVGLPKTIYSEDFSFKRDVDANWTGPNSRPLWSHQRGNREAGALVLGINETRFQTGDVPGGSRSYATEAEGLGCSNGICVAKSPPIDLHNFSEERVFLTFWHMDRLAYGDGADVRAEVLFNEQLPGREGSWNSGTECKLYPIDGYDGPVLSQIIPPGDGGNPPGVTDPNPAPDAQAGSSITPSRTHYFTNTKWEESWSLARFDLSKVECGLDGDNSTKIPLLGHTVRFVFTAYIADDQSGCGDPMAAQTTTGQLSSIPRCYGHGFLVDDISVGTSAIRVRPAEQRALLLDNTTKEFVVVVENLGDYEDLVVLTYDDGNSSAPFDAVRPPAEPIPVAPGESKRVKVEVKLPRDPSLLPTQYRARLNVHSVADPNAFGQSGLDLFFAPRQWAELAINVQPPRGDVQEGAEVFIPITVENTGLVASADTVVRVIDRFPAGVLATDCPGGERWTGADGATGCQYELALPSMSSYFLNPDDASRVLEFRWRPAKGTLGDHALSFEVDPLVRSEEYSRSNNLAVLHVPVVEVLIPDLDIAHAEALVLRNAQGARVGAVVDGDVTRYDVTAGELTTFELKLRNNGRAGATDVDILALIGQLSLPSKNVAYVAPGGEVVVKFNWISQKGEYDLAFKVRSEQVEGTMLNNDQPASGVIRLTVKGYDVAVDLGAVDLTYDPGDEIEIPYTLSNTGNAGEDIRLVARAGTLEVKLDRADMFLREGETVEGVATVRIPDTAVAGEHIITVEAVSRENPMKVAAANTPVRVRATYGGAILAAEATAAPPTFEVPVRLLNDGNSLEPWTVNVRLPPGWTAQGELPARVSVPAFGETTLRLKVTAPEGTPPGLREIPVTARLADGTTLSGATLVDVREVRSAAVRLAGEVPRSVDGALAYPVLVENVGNTEAPFQMLLLDVPEGYDVEVKPSTFALPPGGKTAATLLVTPTSDAKDAPVTLRGYAHFEGVQPDTAEGRANVQQIAVTIARADLRVGRVDITPRAGLEPGDLVEVKAPIENRGVTPVQDLPLHLYVDDVFAAETRISLGAGERRDVSFNWTAAPGEHTLTVVVDPYHEAAEADRADNAVSTLAGVAGDAASGGIAAGSPVPGPGVLVTLLALAAACAALLPGRNRRPPK